MDHKTTERFLRMKLSNRFQRVIKEAFKEAYKTVVLPEVLLRQKKYIKGLITKIK
jgi:hypothetical protein